MKKPDTSARVGAYGLLCTVLLVFVPTVVRGASDAAGRAPRRPNVVFLLSDDQRPDTIRSLGNGTILTPHLDSLAARGVAFTRATCAYPLCVPSRVEILTGRSTVATTDAGGNRWNTAAALWPATMRAAGYQTWYVGKWHTVGRPAERGYDDSDGLYAGGPAPKAASYDRRGREITGYRGWQFQTFEGQRLPDLGVGLTPNISAAFADASIRFIRRAAPSDRPFFLHVNFTAPHDPRIMPPGFEDTYDPARMKLPSNFAPRHPFDHGNLMGRDERLLESPRTEPDIRDELAVYYAIISHLDAQIGRILAALDETDQTRNTIVIFASDHGLALGSHGLIGKQNMYEHTIGVPLVMRGPGIPMGERRSAQCYLRDLFPTVCELAGLEIPASVQGRSLVPVLADSSATVYPFVVGYFHDSQRMIRDDRWKLVLYPKLGRQQLFDIQNDPNELSDLSSDGNVVATATQLREQLVKWMREHNDPLVDRIAQP